MGIFDRFRKKKYPERKLSHEQDQASGPEPIPRYPGSVMVDHSRFEPRSGEKEGRVYVEYETIDSAGDIAMWYLDLMTRDRWKIESWTPPYILDKGPAGNEHFITIVYRKDNRRCDIGTKWYPTHTKIWIDIFP